MIFLAFSVVVFTVVVQGLTLPWLIRRLDFYEGGKVELKEAKARILAAKAAIERWRRSARRSGCATRRPTGCAALYEFRIRRFKARFDDGDDGAIEEGSQAYQRLRRRSSRRSEPRLSGCATRAPSTSRPCTASNATWTSKTPGWRSSGMTRRAWIAFATCSVLWGIPYFFIKVAVDDLPAVFVAWARIAMAAAILLPLAWRQGALRGIWERRWLSWRSG